MDALFLMEELESGNELTLLVGDNDPELLVVYTDTDDATSEPIEDSADLLEYIIIGDVWL